MGIPEEEEKEQSIETLFEKNNGRKLPKPEEGKSQAVQEAQSVPIKMNTRRPTPRPIIIKMPSFKDKERILKAGREKQEVTYKVTLIRIAADFSTKKTTSQKRMARNIPSNEK